MCVSVFSTQYRIGVYATMLFAVIVSCLYFDGRLTTKVMLLTYVCFMAAYVFRSIEISKPIRVDEMLREISKFL